MSLICHPSSIYLSELQDAPHAQGAGLDISAPPAGQCYLTRCQPSLFQVSGGRFQSAIFVTLCDEGTCDSDVCTVQLIALLSLTHWLRPLGPPCLCSVSLRDVSPCATRGQLQLHH